MPVVRTGVYPHMPIAVTANSLQHWPSPSKRFSHMVHDGRASLSHRANHRQTFYRLFSFWPWGLTLGPKVTKSGDDLLPTLIYHPTKFQPQTYKRSTRYVLPNFFTFWYRGLTPGPKFTRRGDDLVDSKIYHLQNFIALCQSMPEISVTKMLPTNKKNKKNSNRYIPAMPIGMWG